MTSKYERQPLLTGGGTNGALPMPSDAPPPYTEEQPSIPKPYSGPDGNGPPLPYPPVSPPAPPPYTTPTPTAVTSGQTFVQCRVCQHVIHVPPGSQSRVVKCGSCSEATPIGAPPPGKKYVRCPCNCLLTCSATATRVICPRQNCKRTIGVGTVSVRQAPDRVRVQCGHCRRAILWPANAPAARCPHCRSRSYLYRSWMVTRATVCLALGLLLLICGAIVTGVTVAVAMSEGGVYVISVGFFISGAGFLVRAAWYFCMTQSIQET